jgi:hypothetical protein
VFIYICSKRDRYTQSEMPFCFAYTFELSIIQVYACMMTRFGVKQFLAMHRIVSC